MIRKLQIKFVAMCMILVTAVLGVVFTAVFFSAKQNIEVISHQVLQRVMEDDTPSGRPDLGLNRGGEDVLLPYFTVNLWDRSGIYEAFVTGGTYSNLQDTQELQTILTDCLQQNRPEGTIHSYGLRYLRRDYGLYERIAFVDMSMEQATLQEIMGSYLQIGLAALLLLLGVSILLARWATRPVAKAWQQQRQFLSDASHELKTPLTAISGYAELIEHGMADAENSKRFAGEIHKNSVRLLSLINDIIQLSQLDGGKNHSEYADIDLYKLAAECVDMLKMNARKQNVTMKLCGKPCTVYADRQLMEELLYNLCDNAIRYNNRGGSVTVTVDEKDGHVFLSIKDTGIGIPTEHQDRVFERFYRVDKSRSKATGGTGLGLAIVKHIVAQHGASISLESQAGKGTEIRVEFSDALKQQMEERAENA